MNKNSTVLIILVLIVSMGLWGQYELDPNNLHQNFTQSIYQILMLFLLEGDWTRDISLPWQLEVTRFLAPLASIAGIVLVMTRGAWIGMVNYFVRFRPNHLIIAGLGDKAWQFIQSSQEKYRIVVVEINPDNLYIERARSSGISVIVGDILDDRMFQRVNLTGARHLVAYTDNDGVNVEMAVKARNYIKQNIVSDTHPLRIHIHINDTRISKKLANYPKFFDDAGAAEINFFSVYEINARTLFRQYPPEQFAQFLGRNEVHIALYFFGRMAEHFLIEAGRICHFANGSKVRFTIFDDDAKRKEEELRQEFPNLISLVNFTFVSLPIRQSGAIEQISETILNTVTEHVVCLPSDEESFTLALTLRATLLNYKNCNAPILVRMQQSSGLAQILESNVGQPEVPDGLYPFGMFDEILHYENVLSDKLDLLARAFHADYLDQYNRIEDSRSSAIRPWQLLSEPHKKNNRLQADHLELKLRAVRYSLSSQTQFLTNFMDDEVELLSKVEHERWRANQLFEGWRSGSTRVEKARINPLAVPWSDIPEEDKVGQRSSIQKLPEILRSRLHMGIQKDFVIGVTGHRPHKLDPSCTDLQKRVEDVLAKIIRDNPNRRFLIASPLAEGADRLIARMAMEKFSMALIVPLPLPYELYQEDFTSRDSVEEFKELVGKAESYFELPMRFGNIEELSISGDEADNPRNKQYALTGAYLTQISDELVAIYDQEPESGTGGTGQIVRWRTENCVDAEFVNRSDFICQPEMKKPIVITPI